LFGASEVSLRDILRKEGSTDEHLLEVISQAVQRKKPKHAGIDLLYIHACMHEKKSHLLTCKAEFACLALPVNMQFLK